MYTTVNEKKPYKFPNVFSCILILLKWLGLEIKITPN